MNIVVLLVLVIELCSFLAQNGLIRNLRREQVGLTGSFKTEILTTTFFPMIECLFQQVGFLGADDSDAAAIGQGVHPFQSGDLQTIRKKDTVGAFKISQRSNPAHLFDHSSHLV